MAKVGFTPKRSASPRSLDSGSWLLGMIVGCFFLLGMILIVGGQFDAGRLIVVPGALILCLWEPIFTVFLMLVLYLGPDQFAVGVLWANILLFPGLMVLNLILRPRRKREMRPTRSVWITFAAFATAMGLSQILTSQFAFELLDYIGPVVFGLTLLTIHSRRDYKIFALAFIVLSLGASLWVIWRLGIHREVLPSYLDPRAKNRRTYDPNYASCWINIGWIIGFSYLIRTGKAAYGWLVKIGLALFLLVGLWAVALLASRGVGLIALVLPVLVVSFTQFKKFGPIFVLLGLIAVLVWQAPSLPVLEPLMDRFQNARNVDSGGGRFDIWTMAITSFTSRNPLETLVGLGPNSTVSLLGWSMHNQFLQLLMDYGVLGLLSFVAFYFCLLRNIFRRKDDMKGACLGIAVYFLIVCLSIVPIGGGWSSLGWLILALLAPASLSSEAPDEPAAKQPRRSARPRPGFRRLPA